MNKLAVILFNLGGPDKLQAVELFLYNLFSDPAIIRLPTPLRQLAAHFIASKRAKTAMAIYEKIGGRSPIFENTEAQARALEHELVDLGTVKCFTCMRYWHPLTNEVVRAVKEFAPDKIILLPLYPQFSTTTTGSSFKAWQDAVRSEELDVPTREVNYYPDESGFIKTLAESTRAAYVKAQNFGTPRLLFSAHGLPEKIVKSGDPYQFQCEQTAEALAKELAIENLDWVLCYQSKVGPLTWIGPSAETEIERAARDKLPIVIVPIAFVSEHSETLYEIDILFRNLAAAKGVPYFDRVATVGTSPAFIAGLSSLVRWALADWHE